MGVITPSDAAAWLTGERSDWPVARRSPCLFTFDDGFESNFRIARDVLDPLGVKALFFVCPSLIDLTGDEQRSAIGKQVFRGEVDIAGLPPGFRMMTWNELRTLKAGGHEIGSHGLTHRRLTDLDGETLSRDIPAARDRLETELGCAVPWYAYTFGDIGSLSRRELDEIARHHRFCRSGIRGVNGRKTSPLAVRADAIDLDAPASYRTLVAEGGLDERYQGARLRLDRMAAL